jgi:hypothetical protein
MDAGQLAVLNLVGQVFRGWGTQQRGTSVLLSRLVLWRKRGRLPV